MQNPAQHICLSAGFMSTEILSYKSYAIKWRSNAVFVQIWLSMLLLLGGAGFRDFILVLAWGWWELLVREDFCESFTKL